MELTRRLRAWVLAGTAAAAMSVATPALAQLAEANVLVVYDSRIADSLAVAEHYAGSACVRGGAGGVVGARPGVRVVDLSTLPGGGQFPANYEVPYPDFVSRFRDPLRAHLTATGLTRTIRCIVLTKGLPHRILDHDNPVVGDNAALMAGEALAGDATCASLDIELALLWQNVDAGEAGAQADSFADGMITNPYARSVLPIVAFPNANIATQKSFAPMPGAVGLIWLPAGTGPTRLTAGDIYLVTRLDGNNVAAVRAMIDRAVAGGIPILADTENSAFVLDESNSNGIADPVENAELDNQGPTVLRAGDDLELTRDRLLADGRFLPANVRYNAAGGPAGFIVGPLLSFDGEGIVVSEPLLMLGHEGSNHAGPEPGEGAGPDPAAGSLYAASFNYAPGAAFNTAESFNGRQFGGLNSILGQEQVADFLEAGGTFGFGNVWEPFTLTLPDNTYVAGNFYLGTLRFAEAAYSALPALSWQQVVLGDPLARVWRTRDDVSGDGAVTIDDLYAWHETTDPVADLNRSGVADDVDRRLLEGSVRGQEQSYLTGSGAGR